MDTYDISYKTSYMNSYNTLWKYLKGVTEYSPTVKLFSNKLNQVLQEGDHLFQADAVTTLILHSL